MKASLTKNTLKGSFWVSIAQLTRSIVKLGVLIYLARLITPKEFGIVGACLVVISFSEIFSELGTGPALVQRKNLTLKHIRVSTFICNFLGILTSFAVFFSADFIASFFKIEEMGLPLKILSVCFVLSSISVTSLSLLKRDLQFKHLALIELKSYLLFYVPCVILLAYFNFGLWSLIFAHIIQIAALSIMAIIKEPRGLCLPLFAIKEFKELLNFGVGFTLGRVFNQIATQVDNLIVGKALGAETLGVYGRAYEFFMAPVQLLGSVSSKVLFPAMSSIQDDQKKLTEAYFMSISIIALITFPASSFLIMQSELIIYISLGKDWLNALYPFQIFAFVLFFRTSYKISDALVQAIGDIYRRAFLQFIYALLVTIGVWFGSSYGLKGVATGMAAAILINYCLMFHLASLKLNQGWFNLFQILLKNICVSSLLYFLIFIINNYFEKYFNNAFILLLFEILITVITWFIIMMLLQNFYTKEFSWLKKHFIKKQKTNRIKYNNSSKNIN